MPRLEGLLDYWTVLGVGNDLPGGKKEMRYLPLSIDPATPRSLASILAIVGSGIWSSGVTLT